MRYLSLFFLILVPSLLIAQQTAYQPFEVDSLAEPRGGQAFFSNFIQANLRKPIQAQAKGISGRVMLTGIVEPDGRISDPKVIQGFRPDCDEEALRVFRLFNAWKPARKNGQAVRQQINAPVSFARNEPFLYINGAKISYFDSEKNPVVDSTQALYKQAVPLDSIGRPTGDIVIYRLRGKSWKEYERLPIARKPRVSQTEDGRYIHVLGYENANMRWDGLRIEIDDAGDMVRQSYYQNGKRVGTELAYYQNGVVEEKNDEFEDRFVTTSWYPNGQIRQIRTDYKSTPPNPPLPGQVAAFWERDGYQRIKNGTGQATYQSDVKSYLDSQQKTRFTEQGAYENGLKQGVWTGRYADGSYYYEEWYDKGTFLEGKAKVATADTVTYKVVEQAPEFKGGLPALGQFLSRQLRYPPNAQRSRVQGQVVISFVVNTEGNVEDVFVLKGIGFGADEEAQRVVKASSGYWIPGTQRGKKVRVKYNLPVNFTLQ